MRPVLNFDPINDQLLVGALSSDARGHPLLREEEGVTGVLNLQSDKDLYRRGIHWQAMWRLYTDWGWRFCESRLSIWIPGILRRIWARRFANSLTFAIGTLGSTFTAMSVSIARPLLFWPILFPKDSVWRRRNRCSAQRGR